MPKYSITLEGENFPMVFEDNDTSLFGFITTRRVKANSAKDACEIALELINSDKSLWDSLDDNNNIEPTVTISDVVELNWWNRLGGAGYSFYPMEEDK